MRNVIPPPTFRQKNSKVPQTTTMKRLLSLARPLSSPSRSLVSPASSVRLYSSSERTTPAVYYALFPNTLPNGPPPQSPFSIDVRALRKEFLQRQQQAHPDVQRHSGPEASKDKQLSALLNKAYTTLIDPLQRAEYLLGLRGIDISEEAPNRGQEVSMELLMEIMEVREAAEECTSQEDMDVLRKENEEKVRHCIEELEEAFKKDDLVAAKKWAVTLRFWSGIATVLKEWEPGKPVPDLIH